MSSPEAVADFLEGLRQRALQQGGGKRAEAALLREASQMIRGYEARIARISRGSAALLVQAAELVGERRMRGG